MHIYGIQKNGADDPIFRAGIKVQVQRMDLWTQRRRGGQTERAALTYIHYCCCCQVASVVSGSVRPHTRRLTSLSHPWDSLGKNTGMGSHFLRSQWGVAGQHRELCDDLEGWNGEEEGDSRGKGDIYIYIYTHIQLIQIVVQQKLATL